MATPQGLVVPNIKDVQNLSVLEVSGFLLNFSVVEYSNQFFFFFVVNFNYV